ncbi:MULTISPECIES: LysR substrate-binding domain-containing protein [unclassified Caballeronia]|uniref:LysR substrate-binding domain-containing protein n=1 Tax=unclassified Caballeronia TaxID=2646786 RepID=UPI00202933DE|nr:MULTISPECIES: LysR substrate-binding domain-containing protein [unclassified Caballeronia]MDR5774476.1 LysR substrate-binding domain-containing protein [Caballeronia sp. LZ002]MDR5849912.1 LysR substrate-binding domain-containing protein [Caballeronia sp. LZ003]
MEAVLDIELLRTFHAVARLGKFRSAAEFVHKSPAAISIHIQRLEAIAGGRLLDRDNQAVTLTVLGKRLLSSTSELLNAHDRVLQDFHGKALAGRVVLGVPDEYASHVIRDILPGFSTTWPNVVLEVRTAPSLKLRDQVGRGKLDVALLVQPIKASRPAEVLTVTTPVWVGSAAFTLDESRPLPLALYAEPCPYRAAMTDALERAGRTWRVILDSASSQAIKACVESGLAVTLLDRARVSEEMRVLDKLPRVVDHEVVLMRDAGGRGSEAIDLLIATLRENFRL